MSTLHIQAFAALNDLTIIGNVAIRKDRFARYHADGVRVAFAYAASTFTVLTCADGSNRYVMTTDWQEVERTVGRKVTRCLRFVLDSPILTGLLHKEYNAHR